MVLLFEILEQSKQACNIHSVNILYQVLLSSVLALLHVFLLLSRVNNISPAFSFTNILVYNLHNKHNLSLLSFYSSLSRCGQHQQSIKYPPQLHIWERQSFT